MKLLVEYLLAAGLMAFSIVSCSDKNTSDDFTVFSGRILNNATGEVRIENEDTVFKSPVNEGGYFKIKFDLNEEQTFQYVGNEFTTIHLSPGDSLFMSVDASTWREFDKTLVFSGRGGEKNNYFFRKSLLVDELFDSKQDELFSMNESEFISALEDACRILTDKYMEFVGQNPRVSYKLMRLEDESIEYLKRDFILRYFLVNQKENNQKGTIKTMVDDIISGIDLNNKDHFPLDTYKHLVIDYFRYLSVKNEPEDERIFTLVRIDNSLEDSILRSLVLRYFIKEWIGNNLLNESRMDEIKNRLSQEFFNQFLSIYGEERPIVVNDPAPEFKLFDMEGNVYSLSQFRGNYIYIDVWASYCGPCLKQVPFFEQLKIDNEGKNITFMSISLDRKEVDWINSVNRYKMTELQLRPNNDWSSDFVNDYSINHYGIPHYIIIDPEGIIIRMPGPKPSEAGEFFNSI